MAKTSRDAAEQQCLLFLESLNTPAFVIVGWKKPDGNLELIQSIKNMHAVDYTKGMSWALNEALESL